MDAHFKNDKSSPLDSIDKQAFTGLHYFEPDSNYRIAANFKRKRLGKRFLMKTTTDRRPEYKVYGVLLFELEGKPQKLTIYKNLALSRNEAYKDYLFCPFKDLTNAEESYGGGRYLDFRTGELQNAVIDFNLCYNPYCAYNYRYSCPIPPKTNHLEVSIKAGVKKYH